MHQQNLDLAFKLMRLHSNCKDQQDACIITDHNNHILGSGTQGITRTPALKACQCMGYCRSSHAVTRAIAACGSRINRAHTAYCVRAPCPDCINLLHGTPVIEIVFAIDEPNSPAEMLWLRHGGVWTHHLYQPDPLKDDNNDLDHP